ncbi:GNAT family N-acetyltransferase [Chitinimonas naiadis]
MTIRALQRGDAGAIATLWHAGTSESGVHEPRYLPRISVVDYARRIGEELARGDIFGWGAFADEEVDESMLAYMTALIQPASIECRLDACLQVIDVDVAAPARGRGWARALLEAARLHARERGLARVEIHWLIDDPRASAVWHKLGFKPYLQRGYLAVQDEPAMLAQ